MSNVMKQKDWVVPVILGAVIAIGYLVIQAVIKKNEGTDISNVTSYARQIEPILPFTVSILSNRRAPAPSELIANDDYFAQFLRDNLQAQSSLGSGILFSTEGWVVTNAHVVRGAENTVVMNSNGQTSDVLKIIIDPETDIAVLQTNFKIDQELPIQANEKNRVGDIVFSIGNPFGIGQSASMGIISAVGRQQPGLTDLTDFIQTDAAINPGNSGGALVNAHGKVIGMNTAIFSSDGSSQGIGFAIPFDYVYAIATSLVAMGPIERGYLGIDVEDLSPAELASLDIQSGLRIRSVASGGPAAIAGIQPNDILLEIDKMTVKNRTEAVRLISQLMPGKRVRLTLLRANREIELPVTLSVRK